ncbi:MAG: glycine zipper domain-containing protein, partial [Verrucomicrobiota bacterium]
MTVPFSLALVGCQNMPGERNTQGAVIGGAAGAAAGSAVAKNNRVLGALIGGALGAGGGYVIAAKTDK